MFRENSKIASVASERTRQRSLVEIALDETPARRRRRLARLRQEGNAAAVLASDRSEYFRQTAAECPTTSGKGGGSSQRRAREREKRRQKLCRHCGLAVYICMDVQQGRSPALEPRTSMLRSDLSAELAAFIERSREQGLTALQALASVMEHLPADFSPYKQLGGWGPIRTLLLLPAWNTREARLRVSCTPAFEKRLRSAIPENNRYRNRNLRPLPGIFIRDALVFYVICACLHRGLSPQEAFDVLHGSAATFTSTREEAAAIALTLAEGELVVA